MKYFNFVILLVLLSVGLVSLGFAGKAGVTSSQQTVQGKAQLTSPTSPRTGDPELRSGAPANRFINTETAQPPIITQSVVAGSAMIDGLAGSYTIPGDFPTLEALAAIYNFVGLSDYAIVELTNTSYLEDVVAFGPPQPGQDPALTLTIKPAAGTNVVVQFKTSNLEGKGFAFSGARNIIIDGINDLTTSLTLEYAAGYPFPSGDAFAATIYVTNGSQNITVQNAHIKGNLDNSVWDDITDGRPAFFSYYAEGDAAGNDEITVTHCTITNATYGMKAMDNPNGFDNGDYQGDIYFTYNKVGGAFGEKVAQAALTVDVLSMHYDYNEIDGIYFHPYFWNYGVTEYDIISYWGSSFFFDFGQPSGGHFYLFDVTSTFSYNTINNVIQNYTDGFAFIIYGMLMRVTYGSPIIHDNRITGVYTSDVDGTIVGMRHEIPAYHNSILLDDHNGAMLATQVSYCDRPVGTTIFNNAFSNEMSGGTVANIRALNGAPPSLSDGNAFYAPNGRAVGGFVDFTTYNRSTGKDNHSVYGPVNFSGDMHITTGPSSAEDIGITGLPVYADIDDEVRSLATPDAGADEFGDLGAPMTVDVFPGSIPIPVASGVPAGVPQVPQVFVKNNSSAVTIAFDVDLTIAGSGDAYGTKTVTGVTLAKGEGKLISFPIWIPSGAGDRTLTATTKLVDVDPTNDTYIRTQPVAAPKVVTDGYIYTFDAGAEDWVGTTGPSATTDWKRKGTFTKLGGVFHGSGASWVTESPYDASTYTVGQYANTQGYAEAYPGPNLLTSPWLDLSSMGGTDLYISFSHSIALEPDWDRAWLEYTTDGTNWHFVGKLNDSKGINWYSEAVYANAHSDVDGGNIDVATLIMYGLIPDADALPIDTWASNGSATPTGPLGWVFVQLRVSPSDYTPEIVKAPVIRFRYVAFSDAGSAFEGWAFDDFRLGSTGATFTGGTISGTVFNDVDGNGVNNTEPLEPGLTVNLFYFGVPKGTMTTSDPGGTYTFNTATLNNGLPGVYNIQVVKPGFAFTLPFGSSGIADVPHPGTGEVLTQDFGTYEGSVSGIVSGDDGGASNFKTGSIQAGAPLGGWTIQLHLDTPTGTLISSAVSNEDGEYTLLAPPYATYVVTEVLQPAAGRQTLPVGGSHNVAVGTPSGSDDANVTGFNFGNFIWGKWTIEVTVDRNGNGVREPADFVPLPFGTDMDYYVYQDNVRIDTVTLGSGNSLNIRSTLDVGQYAVVRVTPIPTGWIQTTHVDSVVFDIATSGFNDTTNFLYFKLITVSGVKYDDTNGNSTKDGVEPPLENWIITLSGDGGGMDTTDSDGEYFFAGVGPGVHNVTETAQTGWVATSGPFNFTAASADLPVNNKVFDFGNFKQICVSGVKFRDRNNNGVKDPGEEGLGGWTINMPPKTPVVTGDDGSFEFCGIGAGSYTLTEVAQDGWLLTVPVSGQYDIITTSGVDVTGLNFGNFNEADTALYRTFTYEQLRADLKKNKTPKVGKTILTAPNMANLEEQLMLELAAPKVGLAGVTDPASGKIKAYLMPKKYGDMIKTFNVKGTFHTGTPKGFDVDIKGKIMTKLQKSMAPTKFNNMLTAQLLTLQVNLYASQLGHTPGGLGSLMYAWPGILNGLTIDEIADYGDEIMTNWAYVPKANYDSLYAGVKRINEAFSNTVVNDTVLGWFPLITTKPYSKSTWASYKTVYDVPCLKANPGVAPRVRPQGDPESMPVVYELGQNYPNPFNPTTTVEFSIPVDAFVTLKVYNLLGQEIATLIDHEAFYSGTEEVDFDASQLASGVYLYRIVAESINDDDVATGEVFTQVKKMVLVK